MIVPGEGLKLPKLYQGVYWEDGLLWDEVRLLLLAAKLSVTGVTDHVTTVLSRDSVTLRLPNVSVTRDHSVGPDGSNYLRAPETTQQLQQQQQFGPI